MDQYGGEVRVIGAPAEETAGADSGYGYDQLFIVAKALVATAEDVMTDDSFLAAIREEFEKNTAEVHKSRTK